MFLNNQYTHQIQDVAMHQGWWIKSVTIKKSSEFSDSPVDSPASMCVLFFFFLPSLDAFQLTRNCLVISLISLPSKTSAKLCKGWKQILILIVYFGLTSEDAIEWDNEWFFYRGWCMRWSGGLCTLVFYTQGFLSGPAEAAEARLQSHPPTPEQCTRKREITCFVFVSTANVLNATLGDLTVNNIFEHIFPIW